MSTPQPVAPPAAVPWYKTAVLRGILFTVFTQVIARVAGKYHIDISALNALEINADLLTQMALDGISAIALGYAAHGRVVKPLPAVTLTQKKADAENAAAASTLDTGGSNVAAPLSQPPEKKP